MKYLLVLNPSELKAYDKKSAISSEFQKFPDY